MRNINYHIFTYFWVRFGVDLIFHFTGVFHHHTRVLWSFHSILTKAEVRKHSLYMKALKHYNVAEIRLRKKHQLLPWFNGLLVLWKHNTYIWARTFWRKAGARQLLSSSSMAFDILWLVFIPPLSVTEDNRNAQNVCWCEAVSLFNSKGKVSKWELKTFSSGQTKIVSSFIFQRKISEKFWFHKYVVSKLVK